MDLVMEQPSRMEGDYHRFLVFGQICGVIRPGKGLQKAKRRPKHRRDAVPVFFVLIFFLRLQETHETHETHDVHITHESIRLDPLVHPDFKDLACRYRDGGLWRVLFGFFVPWYRLT